jgi:hypothetical protein
MEDDVRSLRSPLASWILGCVVSRRDLEIVMGDLLEERELRSASASRAGASRWYWGQVCRSVLPLVVASVQRGGWPSTLSVAAAACGVQAVIELSARSIVSNLAAADSGIAAALSWSVGFPSLVLVSYCATRIRPGAAAVLTAIIVVAVVVQPFFKGDTMPVWKQIAALFVGPIGALAGGAISLRRASPPP